MTKIKKTVTLSFIIIVLFSTILNSQNQHKSQQNLENVITHHDSIFWKSFNLCNLEVLKNYVSNDLEFYHDKDGLKKGAETFIKITKKNLCSSKNNWKLRREVIKGSVKVYPIHDYGAIMTGSHAFYVTENNKPEYINGIAKFTHIWQLKDDTWKITRVLSYDHKTSSQNANKKEILLPNYILNNYTGEYQTQKKDTLIISKKDNHLHLNAGQMKTIIYPQTEFLFFHKESPLTFEFVSNNQGKIIKMIVRERGNIVEETMKI